MTSETYKIALDAAKKELADLVGEQGEIQQRTQEIDQRLDTLRQSIAALSKLAGEEFDEEQALGLTDAIRRVLQESREQSVTAHDVRVMLESRGFNTRRYGNLLASIITVLKRLKQKQQVAETGTAGDRPTYKWIAPITFGQRIAIPALDPLPEDLPVKSPSHPIHNPGPIVKVTPKAPRPPNWKK